MVPPPAAGKYDQAVVEEEAIPLDRRVVAKAGKSTAFSRKAAPAFLTVLITAGWCLKPCSLANVDTLPGQRSQQCAAGKMDAKKRLEGGVSQLMSANIVQCMGAMLDTVVF